MWPVRDLHYKAGAVGGRFRLTEHTDPETKGGGWTVCISYVSFTKKLYTYYVTQ